MTTFGWDASHYDGALSLADLQKAKTQGIELFTHKLGEGDDHDDDDSTAAAALTHARAAGISVLGGYWFCWGDRPAVAQADLFVAVADTMVPWWRQHPRWFWQPDCETESGHGKPSPSWIKQFADRLAEQTGRLVVVYASHGMYGDTLAGLGHPLWNANYPSSKAGQFKSIYPGDSYAGWTKYSGQVPVLAQYSSTATIAGKTTCDANAFRGTLDQLLDFFGGTMSQVDLTPAAVDAVAAAVRDLTLPNGTTPATTLMPALNEAFAAARFNSANPMVIQFKALQAQVVALQAQVLKIPTTAGTATISAQDKADIAKLVLDGFAARQQS